MTAIYVIAGLDDKNLVVKSTIRFLNERIDTVKSSLNATEQQIADIRRSYRISESGKFGSMIGEVKVADQKVAELLVRANTLEDIDRYIKGFKNIDDLIPSTLGVGEPTLGGMISLHNQLALDRQKAMRNGFAKDEVVTRLDDQITEQRKNILRALSQIKDNLNQQVSVSRSEYSKLENEMQSLPDVEKRLLDVGREATVKAGIYDYLSRRKQEAELTLAANRSDIRVIDEPRTMGIVKPVAYQILSFAFILGLGIPVIILLIMNFLIIPLATARKLKQ